MPSEPQATQVNLLRYQRNEIPPNKAQVKQFKKNKFRPKNMGYSNEDHHHAPYKKMNVKTRRHLTQDRFFKVKADIINVEIPNTQRDSNVC